MLTTLCSPQQLLTSLISAAGSPHCSRGHLPCLHQNLHLLILPTAAAGLQEPGHAVGHHTAAVSCGELAAAGSANSLVSTVRPKRPALSSLGRPVAVFTNHFPVICTKWVQLEAFVS